MKVKLLKKLRKRFSWYYRESDKAPILVDHKNQTVEIYDKEPSRIGEGTISKQEYNDRCFKSDLFFDYLGGRKKYMYRLVLRELKKQSRS